MRQWKSSVTNSTAKMGAEAIQDLMMQIEVPVEVERSCAKRFPQTNSETKIKKLSKRSEVAGSFC